MCDFTKVLFFVDRSCKIDAKANTELHLTSQNTDFKDLRKMISAPCLPSLLGALLFRIIDP